MNQRIIILILATIHFESCINNEVELSKNQQLDSFISANIDFNFSKFDKDKYNQWVKSKGAAKDYIFIDSLVIKEWGLSFYSVCSALGFKDVWYIIIVNDRSMKMAIMPMPRELCSSFRFDIPPLYAQKNTHIELLTLMNFINNDTSVINRVSQKPDYFKDVFKFVVHNIRRESGNKDNVILIDNLTSLDSNLNINPFRIEDDDELNIGANKTCVINTFDFFKDKLKEKNYVLCFDDDSYYLFYYQLPVLGKKQSILEAHSTNLYLDYMVLRSNHNSKCFYMD